MIVFESSSNINTQIQTAHSLHQLPTFHLTIPSAAYKVLQPCSWPYQNAVLESKQVSHAVSVNRLVLLLRRDILGPSTDRVLRVMVHAIWTPFWERTSSRAAVSGVTWASFQEPGFYMDWLFGVALLTWQSIVWSIPRFLGFSWTLLEDCTARSATANLWEGSEIRVDYRHQFTPSNFWRSAITPVSTTSSALLVEDIAWWVLSIALGISPSVIRCWWSPERSPLLMRCRTMHNQWCRMRYITANDIYRRTVAFNTGLSASAIQPMHLGTTPVLGPVLSPW